MKVRRIDTSLELPTYDKGAACVDLVCRESVEIKPKEIKLVPVNIVVAVPKGYALLIFVRSSTPIRKGLVLANGIGVIDPFYSGNTDEVVVEFFNITDSTVSVTRGEKLAQAMLVKCEAVQWEEVDEMSEKGEGGYWSLRKNG